MVKLKNNLSIILAVTICFASLIVTIFSIINFYNNKYEQSSKISVNAFSGSGSGTSTDPYIIETNSQFSEIVDHGGSSLNYQIHFKLNNDLTISSTNWTNYGGLFAVCLDGNNYTITLNLSNTNANNSTSYGLFSFIQNSTIKNLRVNGKIMINNTSGKACGKWVGGLTATAIQENIINNCYFNIYVNVTDYKGDFHAVGGVIGQLSSYSGTKINFNNTCSVGNVVCNCNDGKYIKGCFIGDIGSSTTVNYNNCYYFDQDSERLIWYSPAYQYNTSADIGVCLDNNAYYLNTSDIICEKINTGIRQYCMPIQMNFVPTKTIGIAIDSPVSLTGKTDWIVRETLDLNYVIQSFTSTLLKINIGKGIPVYKDIGVSGFDETKYEYNGFEVNGNTIKIKYKIKLNILIEQPYFNGSVVSSSTAYNDKSLNGYYDRNVSVSSNCNYSKNTYSLTINSETVTLTCADTDYTLAGWYIDSTTISGTFIPIEESSAVISDYVLNSVNEAKIYPILILKQYGSVWL